MASVCPPFYAEVLLTYISCSLSQRNNMYFQSKKAKNKAFTPMTKVGIPNFVSGEYIMEGEYVILKIMGLLYLYWAIRLGCYAMGLPMSDSVWNCGRSLVLWVPGTSGLIGNGILGEYFPEREYNLLDPKKTRKRPKFQPCPWLWVFIKLMYTTSLMHKFCW